MEHLDEKTVKDLKTLFSFCMTDGVSGYCSYLSFYGLVQQYPFQFLLFSKMFGTFAEERVEVGNNLMNRFEYFRDSDFDAPLTQDERTLMETLLTESDCYSLRIFLTTVKANRNIKISEVNRLNGDSRILNQLNLTGNEERQLTDEEIQKVLSIYGYFKDYFTKEGWWMYLPLQSAAHSSDSYIDELEPKQA